MTDCTLCAVVDADNSRARKFYDTHLHASASFVIIPALGPVTPGHVMVVSRTHFANLASMPSSAIDEYNQLVEGICRRAGYRLEDVLEAEHGGAERERGGACITHVHVNLIPKAGQFVTLFDGNLPRLDVDHSLRTLISEAAPYMLLRSRATVRLYRAHGVPSQLIRRALFARFGRDDWDWGAFPNTDAVAETLRVWNSTADDEAT